MEASQTKLYFNSPHLYPLCDLGSTGYICNKKNLMAFCLLTSLVFFSFTIHHEKGISAEGRKIFSYCHKVYNHIPKH